MMRILGGFRSSIRRGTSNVGGDGNRGNSEHGDDGDIDGARLLKTLLILSLLFLP